MYKIKQIPEDFIVTEVTKLNIQNSGNYAYFKLTKKNRNTLDVVKELAKQLRIKGKQVGFAGSKDKHAITYQHISVQFVNKDKVLATRIENVQLEFLGYGKEPISLGDLEGNKFEIIVRDAKKVTESNFVENYFDEQRFSKNNARIGKHIIKKEFKEALQLIDNEKCNQSLKNNPNDFIGALKLISKRLLRMYVNSYQSFLWNETVVNYLKKNNDTIKEVTYSLGKFIFTKDFQDLKIPLIGFMSNELETDENRKIIQEIMEKENIFYQDFIIRQMPELSLEGEMRPMQIKIKDLDIDYSENVNLKFFLPKGSYATMVVKKLVS